MKSCKLYRIEYYAEAPLNRWMSAGVSFTSMRKSFAEGAWCMLTAHYNQTKKHRLVCENDGTVVEECGHQCVGVA
jgi:hypothetical protein